MVVGGAKLSMLPAAWTDGELGVVWVGGAKWSPSSSSHTTVGGVGVVLWVWLVGGAKGSMFRGGCGGVVVGGARDTHDRCGGGLLCLILGVHHTLQENIKTQSLP